MFPALIKLKDIALNILFPSLCVGCQRYLPEKNKLICEQCLSLIKLNNTLFCPVCRARLADNKIICHHSKTRIYAEKRPLFLLAAAGNYGDPILQNLIHYFKYKYLEGISSLLSELLLRYFKSLFRNWKLEIRNFIVVPVPLHHSRERRRGFNQAKLLAEFVADNLNLELIDGLKRIKNTESQSKIKKPEKRFKNVADCFKIKNREVIKRKDIILIDDVFTSGATMNEAVKILKQNGAKKIIALVLAKT